MDKMICRYETEIKLESSSVVKLNPQFSLCDILVCYPGKNRNMSEIDQSVIEKALYSLYGVPIVGEWVYKLDGTDEKTWGSHGGKIILDDQGIHFEQTTKPLGFVTKDAVDNSTWVDVLEKDRHTTNKYLKLSGCILWTDRIEETKSVLEKNYGQSMEIEATKGHCGEDNYFVVDELLFSALCVLGTAEPCFESATIGRHYAYDEFKREFTAMLNEYQKYVQEENKGVCSGMKDKIIPILQGFTYENQFGDKTEKFIFISSREDEFDVIDRESGYDAFTYKFTVSENGEISIDFDHGIAKSIGAVDKVEDEFNIKNEIDAVATKKAEVAVNAFESSAVNELTSKLNDMGTEYKSLKSTFAEAKAKLDEYVAKEAKEMEFAHKTEIDSKVEEYSSRMGNYSEYLMYRSRLDYSKTVEQVDVDLLVLLGKYNKSKPTKFSYTPVSMPVFNDSSADSSNGRYGNLFDKIKK